MKRLLDYIIESEEKEKKFNGFAILKPEFLDNRKDFEQLLKDNDWSIVKKEKTKLSNSDAKNLYDCHKDEDYFTDLCNYMSSDDCYIYKLYKDCDDPIKDLKKVKDEARDKWGKDEMKNCMHSSDSKENVEREAKICFDVNKKK